MDNSLREMHCVFVKTSLENCLVVLLHKNDNVSAFKEKLQNEHSKCFSDGEITISAVKIECSGRFFRLSNSMIVSKAFEHNGNDWFIYVDVAVRVKNEVAASSKSNVELLKKKTDITNAPVLEDEVMKTKVSEKKKSKKRKMETSDATKSSRKKRSESRKLCEKVEVEVASKSGKEVVSVPDGVEPQMQYDQTAAPHSNLSDQPLQFVTRESSEYGSLHNPWPPHAATGVVYPPDSSFVPLLSKDEIDRIVTEVFLKVTDELFDEIASKIIEEG